MEMKEASSDIVKNIEKILAYEAEHQKEIERYEDIIQKLKRREMKRTRVFYKALHEIYDPQRGGDKIKAMQSMNAYHNMKMTRPMSFLEN